MCVTVFTFFTFTLPYLLTFSTYLLTYLLTLLTYECRSVCV